MASDERNQGSDVSRRRTPFELSVCLFWAAVLFVVVGVAVSLFVGWAAPVGAELFQQLQDGAP